MKHILLLLSAILIGYGCHKDQAKEPGNGTLNVRMTDAPGVYSQVNVEIIGVKVHSNLTGWVDAVVPTPGIYDLVTFSNGLDTLIATTSLPAGTISQIRLILGTNNSVVTGGQTYPLTIPSGSESGLKLQIHKDIVEGVTTIILLDFDAGRSIVANGNGGYILKPVIRAITAGIDGAIKGSILPIVGANVYAIAGTDTFSTSVSIAGNFLIPGVPAGTYSLLVVPASPYSDTTLTNVVVVNNTITDVGIINL